MDFTEVLELDEQLSQSALSNKALDKYIEISTHLINMEDVVSARKLLLSIGFTKKSVEKFIKIARDNAEMQVSEDFKKYEELIQNPDVASVTFYRYWWHTSLH